MKKKNICTYGPGEATTQLKYERNPCNNFRDNRCHRRTTDDGRFSISWALLTAELKRRGYILFHTRIETVSKWRKSSSHFPSFIARILLLIENTNSFCQIETWPGLGAYGTSWLLWHDFACYTAANLFPSGALQRIWTACSRPRAAFSFETVCKRFERVVH